MKALILAAGFGTRLWPLTEDRTKPAIPFLNRPLISYSVDYLASHGVRDIIVNLHHQPESIRQVLGDGSQFGTTIRYSLEEEILGTSGALDRVREFFMDGDFVVINGKIVTDIDLVSAIEAHRQHNAIATLVLKKNLAREHFSIVEVDSRGCISRFAGFPQPVLTKASTVEAFSGNTTVVSSLEDAPLMFTGIQVLSPRIFEYIPRNCFSHSTTHVYPRAIEAGETVLGHISEGDWVELSTLRRYLDASLAFLRKQGRSVIEGTGCGIEAPVEESVLWDRVRVERGARVRNAVLADDVRIPSGVTIEQAVVVRRDIVREVERGYIVGDNLVVSL
jgi:mannose-1-phosphate guanylyltransferase/phosphomannomutase